MGGLLTPRPGRLGALYLLILVKANAQQVLTPISDLAGLVSPTPIPSPPAQSPSPPANAADSPPAAPNLTYWTDDIFVPPTPATNNSRRDRPATSVSRFLTLVVFDSKSMPLDVTKIDSHRSQHRCPVQVNCTCKVFCHR